MEWWTLELQCYSSTSINEDIKPEMKQQKNMLNLLHYIQWIHRKKNEEKCCRILKQQQQRHYHYENCLETII